PAGRAARHHAAASGRAEQARHVRGDRRWPAARRRAGRLHGRRHPRSAGAVARGAGRCARRCRRRRSRARALGEPRPGRRRRRASALDSDALEVHMILGTLYREKGQEGKAITEHQTLLQRPKLSRLEHANVLLCLGLDYKRGGFVDRALEAFTEVLRLDPKNEHALLNLQKLHEEQHQWTEAYDTRRRLSKLADIDSRPQSQAILAFLENEIG